MNNKLIFFLIFLFVAGPVYAGSTTPVLVGSTSSLGITPARTTIDFEPGLSRTIDFDIINSGGNDMSLVIATQGDLGDYISVPSGDLSISSNEGSKTFSYSLNLPSKLEPGLHTGEVVVINLPEESFSGEAYVRATLAVITQVYVYVPYPGKYAEARLNIVNADKGDEVNFIIPIVSLGEFDLTSVKANVDIYNKGGEKVDSFNTNDISVPAGEKKEIIHKWKADVPIGEYRAEASLIYDEGTISLEGTFSIGSRDLELQEISVDSFSLGEIAKLEMLIENKWSEPISDAYIETQILNNKGDVVSEFKSASYDVEPLKKQTFVSYWDTAGVLVGNYETILSIKYGDKSSTKRLEFQVDKNKLTILGLGYVISEGGEEGGMSSLVIILIGVIGILVLINLLWFLLLRKRLKKH